MPQRMRGQSILHAIGSPERKESTTSFSIRHPGFYSSSRRTPGPSSFFSVSPLSYSVSTYLCRKIFFTHIPLAIRFSQVRRETGRKERVQVPYDEGRASHSGPESCVSDREVWGEALTREATGQSMSHVTKRSTGCRRFLCAAEGNTEGCAIATCPAGPRVVGDPGTSATLSAREPGDLMAGWKGRERPVRIREGWRAKADDARL